MACRPPRAQRARGLQSRARSALACVLALVLPATVLAVYSQEVCPLIAPARCLAPVESLQWWQFSEETNRSQIASSCTYVTSTLQATVCTATRFGTAYAPSLAVWESPVANHQECAAKCLADTRVCEAWTWTPTLVAVLPGKAPGNCTLFRYTGVGRRRLQSDRQEEQQLPADVAAGQLVGAAWPRQLLHGAAGGMAAEAVPALKREGEPAAAAAAEKRQAIEDNGFYPFSCRAQGPLAIPISTSGVIMGSALLGAVVPNKGLDALAHTPFNNALRSAPCVADALDCLQLCKRTQLGATPCYAWTWNAATGKCFMYTSAAPVGSIQLVDYPATASCRVSSGLIFAC